MDYENMGDLISQLRKQKNMTQKDLADQLKVTDKAVSKWERGLSCPDIRTIPILAEILGITTEELLNVRRDMDMQTKTESILSLKERVNQTVNLVFKAVGLAMGIGVLVLSIMNEIELKSAITMLSLGLVCLGITMLQQR